MNSPNPDEDTDPRRSFPLQTALYHQTYISRVIRLIYQDLNNEYVAILENCVVGVYSLI